MRSGTGLSIRVPVHPGGGVRTLRDQPEGKESAACGKSRLLTTCSILTAYPLVKEGLIDPQTLIIDAKSGTSGAGRGARWLNLFCEVNENIKAYGVATHRHTPEIEEQLVTRRVRRLPSALRPIWFP